MKVYRISAVTLKIRDMGRSCSFYSRIPGFKLVYGGATDQFTTFEVGGSKMYLNLELTNDLGKRDFGRIIFHTDDVDGLYRYMKNDRAISGAATFETEPADAPWGERFFHVREPDGYQLSFARPLSKEYKTSIQHQCQNTAAPLRYGIYCLTAYRILSALSIYRQDAGLSLRIILCFAVLSMLYLVFIGVLFYLGVGFIPIAIIASAMILAQYYFSDKIVMWSSGAKLVTRDQEPKLHAMVEKIAQQGGLPMPKVAVMNTAVPNAFATGKSQKSSVVAVTSGLMSTLDDGELEGVVAHELAHIKHRDVLVLTLASLFSTVAFFLMRYALFGSMYGRSRDSGAGMIIVLVVAGITWFVSFLIIRAISRYREFAADRGGAQMTGKPEMLASALLKISGRMKAVPQKQKMDVESLNQFFIIPALSGDVLSRLFSTHPPVEERVRRLREMQSLVE